MLTRFDGTCIKIWDGHVDYCGGGSIEPYSSAVNNAECPTTDMAGEETSYDYQGEETSYDYQGEETSYDYQGEETSYNYQGEETSYDYRGEENTGTIWYEPYAEEEQQVQY
jgi:hypothetical protein